MGNDVSYKIIDISTIGIKIFDEIVRTLGDLKQIPDLKRNLISLSTHDSRGTNTQLRWSIEIQEMCCCDEGIEKDYKLIFIACTTIIRNVVVTSTSMLMMMSPNCGTCTVDI